MTRIKCLFLVALRQELPCSFKQYIPTYTIKQLIAERHYSFDSSTICIITGVGKSAILKTLRFISEYLNVEMIVNFGSAGSNIYNIGSIIIPRQFFYQDHSLSAVFPVFPFSTNETLNYSDHITTVDKFDPNNNSALIDMEAYHIALFSKNNNIPFYCFKCVSDANNAKECTSQLDVVQSQFCKLLDCFFEHNDTVSVIIPTYNREHTLKRAIDSVLNQSVNVQCIVVDDASTDRTQELLLSYRDQIHRVTLSKNLGVSYARNEGVTHSKGHFIAFLDSDDEWKKDKIKHQLAHFKQNPFYNLVQCNEQWIRHGQPFNQKKHHTKQSGFIFDLCLYRCMISPSGVMFRRRFFDYFQGFDTKLRVCEDYDLWLKISRYYPVGLNDHVDVIKYGGHEDQLSALPVLDQYRVTSLRSLLSTESELCFFDKIEEMLVKKQSILSKGALKRVQ